MHFYRDTMYYFSAQAMAILTEHSSDRILALLEESFLLIQANGSFNLIIFCIFIVTRLTVKKV